MEIPLVMVIVQLQVYMPEDGAHQYAAEEMQREPHLSPSEVI